MNNTAKRIIMLLLIICAIVPLATAEKYGKITLLTIAEYENGSRAGETADLEVEIRPGNGKVFLDTFPLTRVGTQISMRFAQQIACKEVKRDCSKYDFIYTIKASSGIVDGPSAGAAATIVTMSALTGKELYDHVAVTGTIDSGGYIGPVGGLKEKVDAAKKIGKTLVMIPSGDRFYDLEANESQPVVPITEIEKRIVDIVEYGKTLQVDVVEVSNLRKAWYYFTGEEEKKQGDLEIDPSYKEVMQSLSQKLCDRTKSLSREVAEQKKTSEVRKEETEREIINASLAAEQAYGREEYYTSASYCFKANVLASALLYVMQSPSEAALQEKTVKIEQSVRDIEKKIDDKKLETINDLQTFMIVKERLQEAGEYVNASKESKEGKGELLAYAGERLYSAVSWSEFFNGKSTKFKIDNAALQESCKQKISEAEERYNYLTEFFPGGNLRKGIEDAYVDFQHGYMALCLFRAAKAKAEINVFLSVLGIKEQQLPILVKDKIALAKQVIAEQQQQGIFPIVGYSYYEYASALSENDLGSALLYAEYALELSNMDIYFSKKSFSVSFDQERIWPFLLGIGGGILITCYFLRKRKEDEEENDDTKNNKNQKETKKENKDEKEVKEGKKTNQEKMKGTKKEEEQKERKKESRDQKKTKKENKDEKEVKEEKNRESSKQGQKDAILKKDEKMQ